MRLGIETRYVDKRRANRCGIPECQTRIAGKYGKRIGHLHRDVEASWKPYRQSRNAGEHPGRNAPRPCTAVERRYSPRRCANAGAHVRCGSIRPRVRQRLRNKSGIVRKTIAVQITVRERCEPYTAPCEPSDPNARRANPSAERECEGVFASGRERPGHEPGARCW